MIFLSELPPAGRQWAERERQESRERVVCICQEFYKLQAIGVGVSIRLENEVSPTTKATVLERKRLELLFVGAGMIYLHWGLFENKHHCPVLWVALIKV